MLTIGYNNKQQIMMKSFMLSALTAANAFAYDTLKVTVDGSVSYKYIKPLDFASYVVDNDSFCLHIRNNNNVLVKNKGWDGEEYAFKPWYKGSHIKFEVDLSHMGCGCVAGLYLVDLKSNDC